MRVDAGRERQAVRPHPSGHHDSSSDALPARSPMPLIVHSTCRAPALIAASVFGDRQPQVVVTMRAERHLIRARHAIDDRGEKIMRPRPASRSRRYREG